MSDWMEAESHADRALEMYERGRWAEAENELRKALSLNPDQPDWHFNLGLTIEAAGRDHEALACYERAAELAPEQVDPLVAAAAVCNRLSRLERAIEWCDKALTLEPVLESAYTQKIDALVRLGNHDEAEATFYLAQQWLEEPSAGCFAAIAESLFERGLHDRAGWCLKEAIRLEPRIPRLRARLAAVLAATGKPQRALQMYLRDLRDDPGNIATLLDYGELLVDLGRPSEAAEKFRRVLEIEPANTDAHFQLGQIALGGGRFAQAHLEFELVLKLDPGFPAIRLSLAEALLRMGRAEAARQTLREELDSWNAAAAESGEPDADRFVPTASDRELFGELLLEAELPADAAAIFEGMVESNDSVNADLLRKYALARYQSGDVPAGVAVSRRVLRLDPRCVASIHNLALAALQEGQLRLAAGWISRGLRISRHDDGLRRLRMRVWAAWLKQLVRRS